MDMSQPGEKAQQQCYVPKSEPMTLEGISGVKNTGECKDIRSSSSELI